MYQAKILPLRLHVDQDALDFLKRFFSFSLPSSTGEPVAKKAPSTEPFFRKLTPFPLRDKLIEKNMSRYTPSSSSWIISPNGSTIMLYEKARLWN